MKILISLSNTIYDVAPADRAKYVSDECYRHILRSVGGIFVLFPGMRGWFKGVRFTKKLTSSFDPFDRFLVLSTHGLDGSVADANKVISLSNKPGFCVFQAQGLDSLIMHELGHAYDHWVRHMLKRRAHPETELSEYQDMKAEFRKVLGSPSEYALKNSQEWFAEQFALEVMSGKKRMLDQIESRLAL